MAIFDLNTHPERWVDTQELADYWKVSQRTVQRLIDKGTIQAELHRGRYRVRTDTVRSLARPVGPVDGP